MLALALVILCLALHAAISDARAGTHIWSGAVNGYWNVPGNWSSGGVPVGGEANLILRFPTTTGLHQSTNNIVGLTVQRFEMTGNGYHVYGNSVTLAASSTGTNFTMGAGIGGFLHLPLALPAGSYGAYVELNGTLILSSPISGAGSLNKYGRGLLRLNGETGNTFTGGFRQTQGNVALGKAQGVALVGPVTIGPSISDDPMELVYESNHQIADAAAVYLRGGETRVLMEGFTDTVGPIDFIGGAIITYESGFSSHLGQLQLTGNVTGDSAGDGGRYSDPTIAGSLNLGNAQRTFTLPQDERLVVSAHVASTGPNGGITVAGGTLQFNSSNSFAGPLRIKAGAEVWTQESHAFGSASGPTILEGGDLSLGYGCAVPAEPMQVSFSTFLTIVGTNAWNGPISIETNQTLNVYGSSFGGYDWLTLGGQIAGGGRMNHSLDRIEFTGSQPNTLSGGHTFRGATLGVLAKSSTNALSGPIKLSYGSNPLTYPTLHWKSAHQISDSSRVSSEKLSGNIVNGSLNLDGHREVIGSIDCDWRVEIECSFGQLAIGADGSDSLYTGSISGTGSAGTNLVKLGAGRLVLGGSHFLAGKTLVSGGTLILSNVPSLGAIHVANGARLAGDGTLAALTADPAAILTPGLLLTAQTFGSLRPANFNPGGGYLGLELGGTNPGLNHDQLVTAGNVNLNGVLLQLSALNLPHGSNSFTLIDVTSGTVTGNFIGLPEGAVFPSSDGKSFRITYQGGTGNDVVVTRHYTGPLGGQISGVSVLPDGRAQLVGSGLPALSYQIQATTTFAPDRWTTIGSVEADAETGVIQFVDPDAINFRHRFYRFMIQ